MYQYWPWYVWILTLMSCCSPSIIISDMDRAMLQEQVKELGLLVNIAWIGDQLIELVRQRTQDGLPTLFFSWETSPLTATWNYTRVKFPHHEKGPEPGSCRWDFNLNQLSKVAWSQIKSSTPEAYHVIYNMAFTPQQFREILEMYNKMAMKHGTASVRDVACKWLKQNKDVWQTWIPSNLSTKQSIYLGGLFPLSGTNWVKPGLVPGKWITYLWC